jgi:hypothetical protein
MTLEDKRYELCICKQYLKEAMKNHALFNDMLSFKRLAYHRAEFDKCLATIRLLEITKELYNV